VYKEVLTDEEYEVLEAKSTKEIFEILNCESIDLVLLDIKYGLESGLDVLQSITKEFPDISVVLCSAHVSLQNDYKSWVADSFIFESGNHVEILKEVKKALSKR
jgi:DNA-binding NtrC family response regulator